MPVTLTDEQAQKVRERIALGEKAIPIAEETTRMWNDPRWSDRVKALWKEANPEGHIPEYDTEQRILKRLDAEKAEREEEKKKAQEKAQDDDLAARRKAIKEKRGFTDDALERLEKLMVERGISHHEDAADLMASREPAPSDGEAGYDRHFWSHDKQPDYQEIARDPEGYGRREILKTLREMQARGQR